MLLFGLIYIKGLSQINFSDSGQSLGDFMDIAVYDVDNDNDSDIVSLHFNEPNKIWINDGNGNFTSVENLGTDGGAVNLADLDNDGDLDAFIVDGAYYSIDKPATVWMNDGTGNFTNSGQELGGRYSSDVALADLDGDDDIDAFVCNHAFEGSLTKGGHEVWLNDGTGDFTNSGQDLGNAYHTSVHLGDIDNDGDMDALVTNNYNELNVTNENEIWINNGSGIFSQKVLSSPYSLDLSVADVDNDNDLDVVIGYVNFLGGSNIGAKLFLNDGNGNYSASTLSFDRTQYSGVETGDLNNDGNMDILFANGHMFADAPNKIWIGDGKGYFAKSDFSFGSNDGTFVKLAYLNNDDKIDAIVGDKIWFNTSLFSKQDTITDYDGNSYNTVTIGEQVWLKENLKTTHYNNGDPVENITNATTWKNSETGAYCDYNNDDANVATYGRLYNGYAVTDNREICPTGWHVPDETEWKTLISYLGGNDVAGGKMKESGTSHWKSPNTGADNNSGFTALPSGYRDPTGSFGCIGYDCPMWSSTEDGPANLWRHAIINEYSLIDSCSVPNYMGFGIRCIKDKVSDTGCKNLEKNNEICIYPNPAQNILQIEYPGLSQKKVSYNIIDITGNIVLQGKLTRNNIDVSKLSKGKYLLSLKIDAKTCTKKIIIQ